MCMTQPKGLYRRHSPPLLPCCGGGSIQIELVEPAGPNRKPKATWVAELAGVLFSRFLIERALREAHVNSQLIRSPIPRWETLEVYWNFQIANEKVRQFNEKYLLDTYLIGDRISPNPGGHWSVEHAKRECEEGEKGGRGVQEKSSTFAFLLLRRSFFIGWGKATARVMVTGVAISFAVVVAYIN